MKIRRAIAVLLAFCVIVAIPLAAFAEEDASIPDAKLKSALRELLQKSDSAELKPSELATLTGEIDLSDRGIKDIRGIEYLTGATDIDLSGNDIETMSSDMDKLVNLQSLNLSRNEKRYSVPKEVADIPNLKSLNLSASKIRLVSDVLSEMTSLESLDLSANRLDEFPSTLLDMKLVNLNIDYNFLDLQEGTRDRIDIDKMSAAVSGEYLAFRQLGRLQNLTYYTSGGKLVVEWDGIDDITFYDGTTASVAGYSVLISGEYITETGASKRSIQIDAVAGTPYQVEVSPTYNLPQFGDFKIRSYTHVVATLNSTGPALIENPESVIYSNPYPTPSPTPSPTPTPVPTATPAPEVSVTPDAGNPSPKPQESSGNGWLGTSAAMTIVLLVVIAVLIAVVAVLLVVILKNKNIRGRN